MVSNRATKVQQANPQPNPIVSKPIPHKVTVEDLKRVELPANLDRPQAHNTRPKATTKAPSNQSKPSVPSGIQGSGMRLPVKTGTKPTGARPGAAKPTQDRSKPGVKPAASKKK